MSEQKQPPKKRRIWQLHLSTAILLMFAAGALIGLNLTLNDDLLITVTELQDAGSVNRPTLGRAATHYKGQGWPLTFRWVLVEKEGPGFSESSWYLIGDCGICVAILVSMLVLIERFIRRREGRKPPAPP